MYEIWNSVNTLNLMDTIQKYGKEIVIFRKIERNLEQENRKRKSERNL